MGKNKNDITLDTIVTGVPSDAYLQNYDTIFGKKDNKVIEASAQLTMIIEDDGSLD